MKKILRNPLFIKLSHWEYWPFHVVYAPMYPYWLWLCLKARSFFFFSAANPSMQNGGFLMESKKSIYDLMPDGYYPKTILIKKGTPTKDVVIRIKDEGLQLPLIGKPDIGMRGMAVQKLDDLHDLHNYAYRTKVDFLLQEYIPYELEAGIFYYRFPNAKRGVISGIVYKKLLSVKGDGESTILQLLQKNTRSILQIRALQRQYSIRLDDVLEKGQIKVVVPYGNHCRGAKFIDASYLIDEELTRVIDGICQQVDGFYYGRMDIRFSSWDDLRAGKNFSIIELNGAGSEPTHIYDSKHSIFFAWKEIIRHWNIMYKISRLNKKKAAYMDFASGIKMFRQNFAYLKLLGSKE
jgi:hypothetical protein